MEQPLSHTGLPIPDPVSLHQSIAQCAHWQRKYETQHATPGPSSSHDIIQQEWPHPHNGALPPSGQQLGLLNCGEHWLLLLIVLANDMGWRCRWPGTGGDWSCWGRKSLQWRTSLTKYVCYQVCINAIPDLPVTGPLCNWLWKCKILWILTWNIFYMVQKDYNRGTRWEPSQQALND